MPGVWDLMDWPNPYWMINLFLTSALFYLAKDNAYYSKYFWISSFLIGLAICTKIQAIPFLPILLGYIFQTCQTNKLPHNKL